ncbi:hypothetical protein [Paenibacillus kandeliae]|uniref:hypothetical protein n=1 Tax=Paenibacillus kandeliae TaxID=3231269 RepID=UPI003457C190
MIIVEMEKVKLSQIVLKCFPDMMPSLKQQELNSLIVLRDGLRILEPNDALEIIQYSICENQDQQLLQ